MLTLVKLLFKKIKYSYKYKMKKEAIIKHIN